MGLGPRVGRIELTEEGTAMNQRDAANSENHLPRLGEFKPTAEEAARFVES
jgi:hypothetical protein